MHLIHYKQGIFEEFRLSRHCVVTELTSKIIHNHIWCFVEVDIQTREDVVTAFSLWDLVKAKTNKVLTPEGHEPSSKGLFLLVG
jgi:uncharacterized protein YabN with tetrapyrrole methylase and pyrophosphatase domain